MFSPSPRLQLVAIASLLLTQPTIAPAQAQAANCTNPQTQMEMNSCEGLRWEDADRELNQNYQQLKPTLTEEQKDKITTAQLAWIAFRDAECELYSSSAEGGSLQPMLRVGCMANLTTDRVEDFQAYARKRLPFGLDDDYGKRDRALNHVYQAVQLLISDRRRGKLITAEQAWIEYRDAVCAFELSFTPEAGDGDYCLGRITDERTVQLVEYLREYR